MVERYYTRDSDVDRWLLGKNLSGRLEKDLDDVAESSGRTLKSCRRQLDNLRRVYAAVEDRNFHGLPCRAVSMSTPNAVRIPENINSDASIYPAATRKAGYNRYRVEMVSLPPRNLFLTGATGFLGVHLLHALLKYLTSVVFCLVRAADEDAAMDRIKSALNKFALFNEAQQFHLGEARALHLNERCVPINADRAQFPGDCGPV
ncbi:Male sterility protein [Phytophthora infestans]|uniref:Male sterility protein n=1 Tax=Phytophthora infestans TaxID=4787 RepID=A0A8S9UIM0_PHYIN|nr:Male sterility protein [Phytophthora infestans]KAF4138774.1 Male sterility protein [Phytophthora infestans]